MKAAGLTVGGFYAHFSSKQALLVESLSRMLGSRRAEWLQGLDDLRGAEWVSHFVRRYLNRTHRDAETPMCPLPAVTTPPQRASKDTNPTTFAPLP